jgi:hypothetical protein
MKRLQRAAVLVTVVEAMNQRGSWCGETNIQKACYFLQQMTHVPLDFDFILYRYGPYSFELTDELTGLLADSILDLTMRDPRYGPSYGRGRLGNLVLSRFPKTISRFRRQVEFVASRLGHMGIGELERLATALYVTSRPNANPSPDVRAAELTSLKPHIGTVAAGQAVREVDKMLSDVRGLPRA